MPCPEVDIGRVEQTKHRGLCDRRTGRLSQVRRPAICHLRRWQAASSEATRLPSGTVVSPGWLRAGPTRMRAILPASRCVPDRLQPQNCRPDPLHRSACARFGAQSVFAVPRAVRQGLKRLLEEQRGLRRSNPSLCRLRFRVHTLCCGSGVLRSEGLRLGSKAVHQLSRSQAEHARSWGKWQSRSPRQPARVLRRRLLPLRQSGPGAFPTQHGSPGLLLRLLPRRPRREGRLALQLGNRKRRSPFGDRRSICRSIR